MPTDRHSDRRYPRIVRVNEVVREVIAEEVERLSDPRLGFVTVTGVEVAPDLRTAKVFYSTLEDADDDSDDNYDDDSTDAVTVGANSEEPDASDQSDTDEGEEEAVDTAKALESARRHLQAALGRQVRLKYLPRLIFVRDPAIATGQRIDDIIRGLHEDGGEDA